MNIMNGARKTRSEDSTVCDKTTLRNTRNSHQQHFLQIQHIPTPLSRASDEAKQAAMTSASIVSVCKKEAISSFATVSGPCGRSLLILTYTTSHHAILFTTCLSCCCKEATVHACTNHLQSSINTLPSHHTLPSPSTARRCSLLSPLCSLPHHAHWPSTTAPLALRPWAG